MADVAYFDMVALHAALNALRQERDLTWADIAREADVTPATFTRMARGQGQLSGENFAALLDWSGLDADLYLYRTRPVQPPDRGTVAAVSAAVWADSRLSPQVADTLEQTFRVLYDHLATPVDGDAPRGKRRR